MHVSEICGTSMQGAHVRQAAKRSGGLKIAPNMGADFDSSRVVCITSCIVTVFRVEKIRVRLSIMAFQPSKYEHVPNSGDEEIYYTYRGESPLSNEAHYTTASHPQPHEGVSHNRHQISPQSANWPVYTSRDDRDPFNVQQSDHNYAHRQESYVSSYPTHSFDSLNPKTGTLVSGVEERHQGAWFNRLSDWWWWELGSVLVSVACFIAIIVTLLVMQNKPLASWHSSISPNAVISTLATVSKASLMLAVAACISQLKWLYFERSTRSLEQLQIFDDASRGPLGALELVLRLSPSEVFSRRKGGAGWAFWASILTIFALALDPFAQQILSFPLRSVPDSIGHSASISTAQVYDSRNPSGVTDSLNKNVDMAIQGAVMNGLYTLDSPINFTCTTANCTWPSFYTVGVCSSCTNVTDQMETTCTKNPSHGGQRCNHTLPSGFKLASGYSSSSGGTHSVRLNATAEAGSTGFNTNITDWLVLAGIIRNENGAGNYTRPEAFECGLSWCAKRYSAVNVSSGEIETPDIKSWPLQSPDKFYTEDGVWLNPFTVLDNASDFDGPNRTFTVNANDHNTLSDWLADTYFKTSNQDAVARALWLQTNMSQTFANIATSMTNKIREGHNSTLVYGTAFREETYIHVAWAWLVLPAVVVLMGVVLLAASMVLSRGDKEGLWKNSILATLSTRMTGSQNEALKVGKWSQMSDQAKTMRGQLKRDGQGGLDFVRS